MALLGSKDLNECKSAELFYLRGTARLGLGQFPASMEDFDQALSLDTNLSMAYYHRGLAWQGLGHQENVLQNLEKALANYNMAIELSPDFAEAYFQRPEARRGMVWENLTGQLKITTQPSAWIRNLQWLIAIGGDPGILNTGTLKR